MMIGNWAADATTSVAPLLVTRTGPPTVPTMLGTFSPWATSVGIAVACLVSPLSSSAALPVPEREQSAAPSPMPPAASTLVDASLEPTSTRVRRLVDASGLTIQQFGHVFSVSRRSVYNWLRGEALAPANMERLHRFEQTLRRIDREKPSQVRTILLAPHPSGRRVLDLLAEGRFGEAEEALSRPLSHDASAPRPPGMLPPDVLMSGLAERAFEVPAGRRRVRATRRTPGAFESRDE